jgi:hypothetical protein
VSRLPPKVLSQTKLPYHNNFNIPLSQIKLNPTNFPDNEDISVTYGDINMGVPVGHNNFVNKEMQKILDSLRSDFTAIDMLDEDPQLQFTFLNYIMGHKITHLLRGLSPRHSSMLTTEFSSMQRQCLAKISGVTTISDTSFDLARIPTGAGLVNADDLREPAYTSSFVSAFNEAALPVPNLT